MLDLSVCIVSWNVRRYLQDCLLSIYNNKYNYAFEVIVVDNNSDDGSVEMLKKNFPQVKLIENRKNRGFSAANNQAVKKSSGKYILFLNPDTAVFPQTINGMIKFMDANTEAGIATCKQLKSDDVLSLHYNSNPKPFSWQSVRHLEGYLYKVLFTLFPNSRPLRALSLHLVPDVPFKSIQSGVPFELDFFAGSFLMTRRDVLRQVGLLDERFFLHFNEYDFCYRVKKCNLKIYFCPQFKVIHHINQSIGQLNRMKELDIRNYSHCLFFSKHKGKVRLFFRMGLEITCLLSELCLSRLFKFIFVKKREIINELEKIEDEFVPSGFISMQLKCLFRVICGTHVFQKSA